MEGAFVLVLLVLTVPICIGIWLIVRAVAAKDRLERLSMRLAILETTIRRLEQERQRPAPAQATAPEPRIPSVKPVPEPAQTVGLVPQAAAAAAPTPAFQPETVEAAAPAPETKAGPEAAPPPFIPRPAAERPWASPALPTLPAIDWERFMGVKLIAWLGGFAMFLGVVFFIKYELDQGHIPAEVRMAAAFITGLGLLVGGVVLSRKDYAALSQTLCATGVLILYASAFGCRAVYHFAFFGVIPTFLLMALITATAFLLADRLNALVVALLGMLGGFLTPMLLSTGQDSPLGLFGYIAILDAGLLLVGTRRQWPFLAALSAGATAIMEMLWAGEFFIKESYAEGTNILVPMAVLAGFTGLYLAAAAVGKRRGRFDWWLAGSTLGLAAVAFAFTAWFLSFNTLAQRPWLIFGFVFLLDLLVTGLVLLDGMAALAHPIAGLTAFGLLALWTLHSLTPDLLTAALVFYFLFAAGHSVFPLVLQRWRGAARERWWSQVFPALALLLVLCPLFQLNEISFLVWPFVLLVDLLAIALAVVSATLVSVLVVLLLTLAATAALILKIPETLTGLGMPFFLLGIFAVFFVLAGVWLTRRFRAAVSAGTQTPDDDLMSAPNVALQLPVVSSILPFLLLMMAAARLPLHDPSPVFGLGLLLVVLLLGVTRLFDLDWMPAIGLACVAGLECAWHFRLFDPAQPGPPLTWYLIFMGVFTLFPFLFLGRFSERVGPWVASALAGPVQFFLIHRLVRQAYPNHVMGLLPAAFALPPLLGLVVVLKRVAATSPARMTQLAWIGGAALFFITLIFPIQFDRQWLTLAWAFEGVALLWLFHRVPHPGLRLVGAGLLVVAFVRLTLNPAVLDYHPRSAIPIFNWYLYAYGLVTLCLFAGARLLAPPRHQVLGLPAQPILTGLGIILAFLLVNIEIADFFSAPGSTLTFEFGANFVCDMTCSMAWALFGLALLWWFRSVPHPGLRLGGVGLLLAAFVWLALHPAVFEHHPHSAIPIFNWYLCAYGLVTVCLFAGARLLAPPRHRVLGLPAPPILTGLGIVMAFLLVNLEVTDYFTAPGSTLTFEFGGNFARDMTYSIAWALFALALLVVGITRPARPLRYSALGLLGVTVLKLFFHDLASLAQLYRIGACIGFAVVALVASFAYQRFFSAAVKAKESGHETV